MLELSQGRWICVRLKLRCSSLGYSKQLTGSYQLGFLVFAGLAALALLGLTGIKSRWRTTWGASLGLARI
jgi:MFS transporter, NNP family, nitrate/nitrite transporter